MDNLSLPIVEANNSSILHFPELIQPLSAVNDPLLEIDGEAISVRQGLAYLQDSGELPRFLLEITRQHLLVKEVEERLIVEPSPEAVEQFILELRLQQGLTTVDKFQSWLTEQGMDYCAFREKMKFLIQVETCRRSLTEPQIERYFQEKRRDLEKLVLSRIVVENAQLANELKAQLEEGSADFAQLARKHSVVDDAAIGGALGAVIRGNIPEEIAPSLEACTAGQIIGPLSIEDRFCLLKVEEVIPAHLDSALRQTLEQELFDTWLKNRVQSVNLKVLLNVEQD